MTVEMCAATRRLKIRYKSEEDALRALEDVRVWRGKGHARGGSEKRAYECPVCKDWHLTKQTH